MKDKRHIVKKVIKNSIAEELEIEEGDILISINGQFIEDALDFHYYNDEEYIEIVKYIYQRQREILKEFKE